MCWCISDGGWEFGNLLFIIVNCWGRLVIGVGVVLGKGVLVIVVGYVYISEYEDWDGICCLLLEMWVMLVGLDLLCVIVCIEKLVYIGLSVGDFLVVMGIGVVGVVDVLVLVVDLVFDVVVDDVIIGYNFLFILV